MTATDKLSKKQADFLLALLNSDSIVEASKKAGIANQTAHKYLNDPTFKEEYRKIRREAFEQATSKIVDSVDEAVEVLREVMRDKEEVGATRVQASRTILANAFKSYEMQEVEERLERIESLLEDDNQ